MRSICIDVGSTFVKYFIFDSAKNDAVLAEKIPFPNPALKSKILYEVASADIKAAVMQILDIALDYGCTKCFFSVQMHGYLTRNSKGTFSNYISWKDTRGDISSPYFEQIDFNKNGTSLKRNLPIVKIHNKGLTSKTEFFTLGSYITYFLTGVNATHKSDGCASGFFNAETLEPILLDNITLPTVYNDLRALGWYKNIAVYTPFGDHQTSFLGSKAEDGYLLNVGTATQLSTLGKSGMNLPNVEERPYFNDNRLLTVTNLTRGEVLFDGYDLKEFSDEIFFAMKKLPAKSKMYVGGGGAEIVFDYLKYHLADYGVECIMCDDNIGMEGLKMIAQENTVKLGTMLSEVCFPNFPIILKNSNLDFFIVDNEHGSFDYSFISAIVMNANLCDLKSIIRISDNSRKDIIKFADMGAGGFLLPMTNTAEDIKQVVKYGKYAPIGSRGISTNRAHTLYNPPPIDQYMEMANKKVKVYAQIETVMGVQNIDEILAVEGVDGVFIGPNDLSCDMGCIGNFEPIKEAISKVAEAAQKWGKTYGIITAEKPLIEHALSKNVDFISYGSEINMLKSGCKNIIKQING